eukprot:CAMPEP_0204352980 /NCGR_PEP_ID=MMETSP0469-20131031/32307_1 /ASSEMBLY_ACC=CAM_ASM_000384 /TAXON_ID=2969 /ORGANISM="Oxyrrhis marina" /LENGTH=99 /DNA_ID=CAMNT_0051339815 /DNA_START=1359 /DNA_END=1661 /DNA_ORIENTATION=+
MTPPSTLPRKWQQLPQNSPALQRLQQMQLQSQLQLKPANAPPKTAPSILKHGASVVDRVDEKLHAARIAQRRLGQRGSCNPRKKRISVDPAQVRWDLDT